MPELLTIRCLADNYAYLLHGGGETVLIDAPEAAPVLAALAERGWRLDRILLTHHHADHVQAVPELVAATGARVAGNRLDAARLPPLDEAFFKANQVDDLEGLKASVRNNLKLQKDYQNRAAQRRQVTEALAAKLDFGVPESLVEAETQSVLRQFIEENMRRGIPAEQFEKDKKELFEGAKKAAAQRVKTQLILAKIAEAEKIQVTEKDIDAFIYREAMRTNQKPDKLVKDLSKDRDRLRAVQQSIIFDKAVDFLVSKATVTTPAAQG